MQAKSSNAVVEALVATGINLVAIDFDCTLISHHTGGKWRGEAPELANGVREVFRSLVPKLMDNALCIAIVTFSGQTELIRDVLRLAFPNHGNNIVIRARDHSWGFMGQPVDGKQKYMASAAEECTRLFPGREFTRNSTLLIDDDVNNIRTALNNSVRAVHFNPNDPNKLIPDLLELRSFSAPAVEENFEI